jgi:hypothetical protein
MHKKSRSPHAAHAHLLCSGTKLRKVFATHASLSPVSMPVPVAYFASTNQEYQATYPATSPGLTEADDDE